MHTNLQINTKIILATAIVVFGLLFLAFGLTLATSPEDIVFPVAELGNCKDEAACKTYCDQPKNLSACLDFAEEHDLIPEDELEMARNFEAAGGEGPGGCTSQESCEGYCNDIANIDECLEFAEENDLMPPEELEEALKVQAALAGGATLPGGCRTKDECEDYCESGDSSRMEECIAFAEAAGFIPEDELEEAKMVLEAIRNGATPPPCRGREECDEYCAEPDNFEQCITFAEAAGFMSPEEVEMARKTGGKGPGGCRGRECEDFCEQEENMPVCIDFAIENGLMDPEEAEMVKKTGGKGPGNCRGKEECESFCEDPANQETCFNFAKEHGLILEEDLRQMEEGKNQMLEAFDNAPPEVQDCLNSALGADFIEKLRAGTAMPSRELGDKMQECFGQMMGQMGPPEGGFPGGPGGPEGMQEGFEGPGGCQTPQECMAFCQENPDECEGFGPPSGDGGEFPGGPGGFPGGQGNGFEGMTPPEGFEGRMPPEGFGGEMPEGFEGRMPPDGFSPVPNGTDFVPQGDDQAPSMTPEAARQFQDQYQQQYQQQLEQQQQQEFQRQSEQQSQQQYQQQMQQFQQPPSGGMMPPEGGIMSPPPTGAMPPAGMMPSSGSFTSPPDGSFSPPPSYTPPSGDSFSPPSDGSFTPPPSSAAPKPSLLGSLLQIFLNLFR